MQWNEEHTTVGTNWGHGPSLVNGIQFSLDGVKDVTVHALDGTGKRLKSISDLSFSAEHHTVWYELTRP
jgi:hypothetical protein